MPKNKQPLLAVPSKWISEELTLAWLGVSRVFMNKFAKEKKVPYTYLTRNRVKMYDREAIEAILESNAMEQYIQETHQ